jgi:soluble lytic murein transglycosylase-like protein
MIFSNYRVRLPIATLMIACVAFLSSLPTPGNAKEVRTASGKRLSYPAPKSWIKTFPIVDSKVQAKIKSVITDYKTGLGERQKDQISKHILKQSKKYGYDPLFLTALIITESSFNHRAKSKVGALGLMQIRPRTGKALASESNIRWRGKRTLYHPENNIALGSYYLSKLIKRFGKLNTALEAYNHGPTRIARYLRKGKHPKKYSGKVFAVYNKIRLNKAES